MTEYLLRIKMSQGEIIFINENKLSKIKKVNPEIKLSERIVLQGITGVNENVRLKMMIVKNAYCANSLNYLTIGKEINKKYLLAIFNSNLLNFIFSKFSTNSNVNGYEIDNLPICLDNSFEKPLITLVDKILSKRSQNQDTTALEREIDVMVYKLYELTYDEVLVVDKDFWMEREEYEKIIIIEN